MKDALGNDLKVGDLVAVQLERPLIFGRVIEATEGGMVAGVNQKGEMEFRPGRLVVVSNHPIEFDPRNLVRQVIAVRDDFAPKPEQPSSAASDGPEYHFKNNN